MGRSEIWKQHPDSLKPLGILFAAGENLLTLRTQGAVDNTPSHACGYRFGYVVHCTLSRTSWVCAPVSCRDQDGEGQVAESIAELAVH